MRRLLELRELEAARIAHLRFTRDYSARVIQRGWWIYNVRKVSRTVNFVERNKVRHCLLLPWSGFGAARVFIYLLGLVAH